MRSIILILLCIAFVPSIVLGQTAEIDALREKAEKGDVDTQFFGHYFLYLRFFSKFISAPSILPFIFIKLLLIVNTCLTSFQFLGVVA